MRITWILAIILTGILLTAEACGGPANPPVTTPPVTTPPVTTPPVIVPPSPPAVQRTNEVWAISRSFQPGILTVSVGTTVVWVNKDGDIHTIVSDTGLFNGSIDAGSSFNYTFTKPGNYEYQCDIHPGMAGAIHVQ